MMVSPLSTTFFQEEEKNCEATLHSSKVSLSITTEIHLSSLGVAPEGDYPQLAAGQASDQTFEEVSM